MVNRDLNYYMNLPYTKLLQWSDEDGVVVATIEEIDGCIAHGADDAEAATNLGGALEAWIEHALANGQSIPEPEPHQSLPSGKLVARLPRHLHGKLARYAKRDGCSLNSELIEAVSEFIGRREGRAEFKAELRRGWQARPAKWSTEQTRTMETGPFLDAMKDRGAFGEGQDVTVQEPKHHHLKLAQSKG